MHLVQIFLPVEDNDGNAFPKENYARIRKKLAKKFGGMTAYSRAPAEGLWTDQKNTDHHDDIVIFEVMLARVDVAWWRKYKKKLETLFSQEEIIIRAQRIRML